MAKKVFLVTWLVVCVVLLYGKVGFTADTVKIGVLVPLSGVAAQGGLEMKMGIEMAAAEKKTLLGKPIELIVEDTQVKPPVAISKAEKLVFKDGCISLIGVFSSGVGLAIAKKHRQTEGPFPYHPCDDN